MDHLHRRLFGRYVLRAELRPLVVRPHAVNFDWVSGGGAEEEKADEADVLKLQFSLPKGSYATCAMRELSRRPIAWD